MAASTYAICRARLFYAWLNNDDQKAISGYSEKALARVWKSERFSWLLTMLMHRFPDGGPFDRRVQVAEFDHIASAEAEQRTIVENYVGLLLSS